MNTSSNDLSAFIQSLPKTEMHLHFEGAVPYDLLRRLDPGKFPENPAVHRAGYKFPTFPYFEQTLLDHAMAWYTSLDRYHEAAKVIFERHAAQNIKYVETSFHLPMIQFLNVPGQEFIHAIKSAAPHGLEVRVIAAMERTAYRDPLRMVIDDLVHWDDLDGVDIHGYEKTPTEPWTAPVWARIRAAGKLIKCHAGEFGGADRVREAIEELGVSRVEHGVRAIEDPEVVKLAVERDVTFDVCPISNVRLRVVPSMAEHPIKRLMDAGVRCTVSTDDPVCFANTVNDEYMALASDLAFTRRDLAKVARNGFEAALLTADLKNKWMKEIDALQG